MMRVRRACEAVRWSLHALVRQLVLGAWVFALPAGVVHATQRVALVVDNSYTRTQRN